MKKRPFKFNEEIISKWKESCLSYLKTYTQTTSDDPIAGLFSGMQLIPKFCLKGYKLLEPNVQAAEAFYLKKGSAKLYNIDGRTGEEKIKYIWTGESIIAIFAELVDNKPNEEFYISLMEDSELVSISHFFKADAYKEHTVAFVITQKLMSFKTHKRMLHIDILQMVDKKMRYVELKKKFSDFFFPSLRLSNAEICGFIEISETTLKQARRMDPDE